MPRGHCRHFLFISQDPAGRSPSQKFFSASLLPAAVPQHWAQCVAHSRHTVITTDGQSFQWEASVEAVWLAGTAAIQRLQLFVISCLLACLAPLSKKLAHPWFLGMILFSLLVCHHSQRMIQSFGYTELCYIKFNLRLGATGEKSGNLWALYNKDLIVS